MLLEAPRHLSSDLLVVDSGAQDYVAVLRGSYRVASTSSADAALQHLQRIAPAAVIADMGIPEGRALDVCRRVRSLESSPALVVTATDAALVPDALIAGCDTVLLKPFAPNLLFTRLARLLRSRELRRYAMRQRAKAEHLHDRSEGLLNGYRREWPDTQCPYCGHAGVTSFEYASHRREWYACLACKKVWLAKRRDV